MFISRQRNKAQRNYTTTEKELPSIIAILLEFHTILLGCKIEIHTGHKNLVHETTLMKSDYIMRWRLLLEEYDLEMHYIPGPETIVADTMSRIPVIEYDVEVKQLYARNISTKKDLVART